MFCHEQCQRDRLSILLPIYGKQKLISRSDSARLSFALTRTDGSFDGTMARTSRAINDGPVKSIEQEGCGMRVNEYLPDESRWPVFAHYDIAPCDLSRIYSCGHVCDSAETGPVSKSRCRLFKV